MRENRPYGSEGGGAELNRLSLPLSLREKRANAQAGHGCRLSCQARTARVAVCPLVYRIWWRLQDAAPKNARWPAIDGRNAGGLLKA